MTTSKQRRPSRASMELDLDAFLRSHGSDLFSSSSSDDDNDVEAAAILHRRTVDEILNDSDSSSSSSSPKTPPIPSTPFPKLPDPSLRPSNSSTPPKPTPETLEEEESPLSSTSMRRSSLSSSGLGRLSVTASTSARPLPSLFSGVRPSMKPGAALAVATAASRSIPTPHAAAIKSRRAGSGAFSKVLQSQDSIADSDAEVTVSLDGSDFPELAASDGKLEAEVDGIAQYSAAGEEAVTVEAFRFGETSAGDDKPCSAQEETVEKFEAEEGAVESSSVVSASVIAGEKALGENENSLQLSTEDIAPELMNGGNTEIVSEVPESRREDYDIDAAEVPESRIDDYEKNAAEKEFRRKDYDIDTTELLDLRREVYDADAAHNCEAVGSEEEIKIESEIDKLVQERLSQLESSKKAEKKLRASMTPLELAEELEKKQASSGLHWEEGAAAQPMRLEGIRRGPPAVGYMQMDLDNAITQTISSQQFKRDHGSPHVLAVHMSYIAMGTSRGSVLVVPSKYSAHSADSMETKILTFGLHGEKSQAPATSMCFNLLGDLLLVGYGDGHVTVWDVQKAVVAKIITGEHSAPVVHTLFIGQDSQVTRHFKVVTGDARGIVLLHAFSPSVVPLINRFSVKSQCLLDGQNTGTVLSATPLLMDGSGGVGLTPGQGNLAVSTSGLGSMVGGVVGGGAGWKLFTEGSSLVEEGVVIFVTHQNALVVRLSPNVEAYHKFARPDGVREGSIPYTAWKSYVCSNDLNTEASDKASWLVIAWDRKVQVAKLVKSELKSYKEWNLDSAAIGVAWLDDQMLVVLTLRGQLCLFAKDGNEIHRTSFAVNSSGIDDIITYHTHFTNVFGNPEKAYHNSIAVRGATIYILGPMHLIVSRLLPWKERIQVLQGAGDWMGALDMAMRLYDGQAHGVIDLPRSVDAIREAIMPYLVELLLSYVDEVFSYISVAFCNQNGKMEEMDDPRSREISIRSEIEEQYARVGGVAVEFCVHIKKLDILFDSIFCKFVAVQHGASIKKGVLLRGQRSSKGQKGSDIERSKEFHRSTRLATILCSVRLLYVGTRGEEFMHLHDSLQIEEQLLPEMVLLGDLFPPVLVIVLTSLHHIVSLLLKRPIAPFCHKGTFLEILEPYILRDMLGCLPPEIMQALVEHYSSKGWLQRVEQCVLHMDISSLDFNQVVKLCREHGLYGALIYLFNRGLNDYRAPLEELLMVVQNSSRRDVDAIGYRMLVYLKHCFQGLAFPPGHGTLPSFCLQSARKELLQFLLEESKSLTSQVWKSFKLYRGTSPNLCYFLWLDTEATLEVLKCVFFDGHKRPENSLSDFAISNIESCKGDNFGNLENDNVMGQGVMNTLIAVLDLESDVIESFIVDSNAEAWPTRKELGLLLEFIALLVSCNHATISGKVLKHVLEYLTSRDPALHYSGQKTEAYQRENLVIALLKVVPQTEWNSSYMLDLCMEAQFYKACGLIHTMGEQHVAALDSYMKNFNEPLFTFAFINNMLLLLKNGEASCFRSAIISRIPELVKLSREFTFFLVIDHFGSESQHIISDLHSHSESLFLFLKTVIDVHLSGTLNVSVPKHALNMPIGGIRNGHDELDTYLERLSDFPKLLQHHAIHVTDEMAELYLELLCQYERSSVLKFLKTFENYRLEHCLRLCQEYGVTDAAAFLLERVGDVGSALVLLMNGLKEKFGLLITAVESKFSEITAGNFTKIESLNNILRMAEVIAVSDVLHASIGLCQRNTQRLNSQESDSLWFQLLDLFSEPLRELCGSKESLESRSHGGKMISICEIDVKGDLKSRFPKLAKCSNVLRKVFTQFIGEIIEGMTGYVPLPAIMAKLLSDNGNQEFGDFKLTILRMLGTYGFERRILDTAKSLIEDDTFHTMNMLKKGASHAYAPHEFICCICGGSLTKESSSLGIRLFSCGHATHLHCESEDSEPSHSDSSTGCPICLHKKNPRARNKSIYVNWLVDDSTPSSLKIQGNLTQHLLEPDRQEKPYGLQQMSRFEILSNLHKAQQSFQLETLPQLKLSPPAIYHEKVRKGSSSLMGEMSSDTQRSEKANKSWKLREPKKKGSANRFNLKSNMFGQEKKKMR